MDVAVRVAEYPRQLHVLCVPDGQSDTSLMAEATTDAAFIVTVKVSETVPPHWRTSRTLAVRFPLTVCPTIGVAPRRVLKGSAAGIESS